MWSQDYLNYPMDAEKFRCLNNTRRSKLINKASEIYERVGELPEKYENQEDFENQLRNLLKDKPLIDNKLWYKALKFDGIRGRLIKLTSIFNNKPIYKLYLVKSSLSYYLTPNEEYRNLLDNIDWIDVEVIGRQRPGHSYAKQLLDNNDLSEIELVPIVDNNGKYYGLSHHLFCDSSHHNTCIEGYVYYTSCGMFKFKNYIYRDFELLSIDSTTKTNLTLLIARDKQTNQVYKIRLVGCKGKDHNVNKHFKAKCRMNFDGQPEELFAYPDSL